MPGLEWRSRFPLLKAKEEDYLVHNMLAEEVASLANISAR